MVYEPALARKIFLDAVDIPTPERRSTFLDEACAGDPDLRRRVEALIEAHERPESVLDRAALAIEPLPVVPNATADASTGERPGSFIGVYKLLQQIGEGGMGAVFMAEQTEPVQRKVALKIIKPGMDSRQVLARFAAERQALALMDHPNIAKVLDAGATDSGRPYFVMELVKGIPITQFCDERRLTPRERLELAIPVCQAVQHAHQKGVIHRDLKPSNVLIALYDGKPVPKIIDFGVAKATGPRLTDKTLYTEFGAVVGTLEYMSPEQAELNQLDIDTRSDIYSLGVLLYELLTGTTPLGRKRLKEAALLEVLRLIREEESQRPSLRLSTTEELPSIAACRNIEPRKLSGLIRGELDWIVMKALEKDRDRRYETANGLAADLRRYLNDEPVQAGRPSALYRFRKLARRNKVALTTVALVAMSLLSGTVVSTWQGLRATRAEHVAQTQLYFSRIALAERELASNHGARAEELLDLCRADQRGWEWHFLKRRMHEEPMALLGHTKAAGGVAFSPDGRVLASASFDGTVRLWNPVSGVLLRVLSGDPPTFSGVAFSPDGQRLVAGSFDGTVTVWDLAADRRRLLKGHTGRVRAVACSPDGRYVASASRDGTVIAWDLNNDQKTVFIRHGDAVYSVAYSPDGTRLGSASQDQSVRVWDVRTGRQLLNLTGHRGQVNSLAFSPDGRYLATGGEDRTVRIWDAATGSAIRVLRGHTAAVSSLAFSPDGRRLVSAAEDTTVRVWDPATGQEALTLRDHTRNVLAVAFSPDGRHLASAGFAKGDAAVRIWNATPLTDDGSHEAVRVFAGHTQDVNCVAFSPNGRVLASGSDDKTVRVRDAITGQEKHILYVQNKVNGVAFSPNGTHLAACGDNGMVTVLELGTGQLVFTREASRYSWPDVIYSPDGQRLALADSDGWVRILDATTGKDVIKFNAQVASINAVAFSPDGHHLATAGDDKTLRIWDMSTMKAQVILGHDAGVNSVAYHPDGKTLATASNDGLVILWDAMTSKKVSQFRAHRDAVNSVKFSPDGRRLATASRDGTVKCWNATTGALLCLFRAHQQEVFGLSFHPDGRQLASAGADGTLKLWALPAPLERSDQTRQRTGPTRQRTREGWFQVMPEVAGAGGFALPRGGWHGS